MFQRTMYLSTLTVYTLLVGVLLVYFKANVLFVIGLLSVLPLLVFWFLERLHTRHLTYILIGAALATVFVESVAYINGLWYEVSPFDVRVLGLFPLEAFVAGFAHVLYFIVMYEYFFDDRRTTGKGTLKHTPMLLGIVGTILSLSLAYVYIFSGLFFSYTFALLIVLGSLCFLGLIIFFRVSWRTIGKKCLLFAMAFYPVSLIYEYIALENDLRFFANFNEYIHTFNFYGFTVPVEELIFIFLVPFWVAVSYELYLDDEH